MAARRTAPLLMSGLLLAGAVGVLTLGTLLAFQAADADPVGVWLIAWSLLFATVLPVAALVLIAAQLLVRYGAVRATVPRAGLTIPKTGQ